MDDLADGQLVRLIHGRAAGRERAEAALCKRFAPRVRLYGLKHLRSEEAALDLTQTVLLALLEAARAGRIDAEEHVDRFVFGICRNTMLRMRQQGARVPLATEQALDALSTPPQESIALGPLYGCLQRLDVRARQVLMGSFLEERATEELAEQLGLSTGNVRVLRHRALASLRQCLDGGAELQP